MTGACVAATCGDGIITPPEECDDGNRRNADGCSDHCSVEQAAAGESPLTAQMVEIPFVPTSVAGTRPGEQLPASVMPGALGGQAHAPVGDTGPATLAVMAAGAAVGGAWTRRRKKKM